MDKSKPSDGAMRAAKYIADFYGLMEFADVLADVIDEETRLPELIEALDQTRMAIKAHCQRHHARDWMVSAISNIQDTLQHAKRAGNSDAEKAAMDDEWERVMGVDE